MTMTTTMTAGTMIAGTTMMTMMTTITTGVEETITTEETAEMMTASTVQLSAVLSMSCTSARKIIPCGPTEKSGQQALQTEKAT